ncbi:hypothetical protein [Terrilactibacillus laevilacticus]
MKLLKFLSEFAMSDRYYNIDYLTGRRMTEDPLIQWANIQDELLNRYVSTIKKRKKKNDCLKEILNENSYVIVYSEKNKLVKDAKELIEETDKAQLVQGYAVYYLLQIIRVLATIIEDIEYEYNLYPCLRELFEHYNYDYSKAEIINKKKWTIS